MKKSDTNRAFIEAVYALLFACIVELFGLYALRHEHRPYNTLAILSQLMVVSIVLVQFFPMTTTRIIVAAFWWYMGMSAVDWWVHKKFMHDDASPIPDFRRTHKIHHLEAKGLIDEKTGESIYFSHQIAMELGVMTLPIALLCGGSVGLSRSFLFMVAITHIFATNLAIGMHNTAHSIYHGYEPPMACDALSVFLPSGVLRTLHRHHELHHIDPTKNLCVIFLGFDAIAGTQSHLPRES